MAISDPLLSLLNIRDVSAFEGASTMSLVRCFLSVAARESKDSLGPYNGPSSSRHLPVDSSNYSAESNMQIRRRRSSIDCK